MRSTIAVVLPVPAPASTKSVLSKSVSNVSLARASNSKISGSIVARQLEVDPRTWLRLLAFLHLVAALRAHTIKGAEHAVGPARAAGPSFLRPRKLRERARPNATIDNCERRAQPFRVVRDWHEFEDPLRAHEPVRALHPDVRIASPDRGAVYGGLDFGASHDRILREVVLLIRGRVTRLVIDESGDIRSRRVGPEVDSVDPAPQPSAAPLAQVDDQLVP